MDYLSGSRAIPNAKHLWIAGEKPVGALRWREGPPPVPFGKDYHVLSHLAPNQKRLERTLEVQSKSTGKRPCMIAYELR